MKIAYILPSLAAKAPVFIAKRLSDFFISKGNIVEVFYFDEIFGTEFNCKTTHIKISEPIDFDSFDIIVNAGEKFPDFAGLKFPLSGKKIYYSKPTAPTFMRSFIL